MPILRDTDGKPGLRIETAASVILRDFIQDHADKFTLVVGTDRAASQAVVAAYIDGLSMAMAATIIGGLGSYDDVVQSTVRFLRDALERDLRKFAKR